MSKGMRASRRLNRRCRGCTRSQSLGKTERTRSTVGHEASEIPGELNEYDIRSWETARFEELEKWFYREPCLSRIRMSYRDSIAWLRKRRPGHNP